MCEVGVSSFDIKIELLVIYIAAAVAVAVAVADSHLYFPSASSFCAATATSFAQRIHESEIIIR